VQHLRVSGAAVRWEARLVPYLTPEASPDTCSPSPWAHVKIGQRLALRQAYAAMLRARVAQSAPPVKISPPALTTDGTGTAGHEVAVNAACLFCGIGYPTMSAAEVEQAQGRANAARQVRKFKRIAPQSMGGRLSPTILVGHLCATCNDA